MALIAFSRQDWLYGIFLFSTVLVLANVIHYLLFRLVRKGQTEARRSGLSINKYLGKPARAVFLTIGLLIVLPLAPQIPSLIRDRAEQLAGILLVILLGWLAIGAIYLFQSLMLSRYDTTAADNLRARRVHTQMQFFRRMLIVLVVVLDAGALLWSLHDERLWKYGTGLLASAGLASLVLALAAKSTASNLLAGLQIALTEPIRIDDVVVVNGEWGKIEEITTTYVVVKIWDLRRLVVPLSYFIEQPFENWTRERGDILGTAFLYVDYSVPVEPLRQELQRLVSESPLWDKRVCGLQVTKLTEHTMELRCLVSSAGSSQNFDLRCLVREKMIEFLRTKYPQALPTSRIEMRDIASNKAVDAPAVHAEDGVLKARE
ncbi:MAG: mechanosensitive ion channel [Terracidiphilus sp.]|nr:mechanosensitive ion channel [Terracidiphilus sp.]